jgi:hypothetical protein
MPLEAKQLDHDRQDADAIERRLIQEFARGPTGIDPPSSFEAMSEAAFRERQFSRPCPACKGSGARHVSERRLRKIARRLHRATSRVESATIRDRLRQESECRVCSGTGYRPPPERRGNLQRTWCEDCRGLGDDRHGDTCQRCLGQGSVCLGSPDPIANTVTCPRCRGGGEVMDEEVGDVCQLCRGEGCTEPLTVRATGVTNEGGGRSQSAVESPTEAGSAAGKVLDAESAEARDEQLIGAFATLQENCPELARVVALYRGAAGNRWAHGSRWGRTFAVWGETASGRLLLREASDSMRRDLGARPLELLAAIREREERASVPDIRRRALLGRADREARRLIESAKRALAEVVTL